MPSINIRSREVCQNLADIFGLELQEPPAIDGEVPIGIEIEVKFSSFFPSLWLKYGLDTRTFGSLSPQEAESFTRDCTLLEAELLPKLKATIDAGVPRGNDRYWEFALDPAHDVGLLVSQVDLLTRAGVLPRDRTHSLQLTLGNLKATPDVYYLALLLELQTIDRERIAYGLDQAEKTIHTGWARKGRSGVLEKGAADLKHGSVVACELRPLQLPVDQADFSQLMADASWGANAIAAKQGIARSPDLERLESWNEFVSDARRALIDHGLPDRNWSAHSTIDRSAWLRFSDKLHELRHALIPHSKTLRFQP